ncbi:hypothetical protein ASPSYDRAFT_42068 [Aspergillus sydowii CBS 593.65]|uniref:Uncharacterized protein n=1 Tax=Aspergillus sydowii CBS 593.65 TaxID=1036612 RepID=A0A1L9TLP0_9EURO|nr:uncharacterized protein ASPSYDRAFT_42068 [Aspergillus sydowii CBS 593.65]OJJ60347.1 hypothetical protein ASPSYDRAFT_42068 [Aspergillus sydowii CBS 593.65]
MPDPATLPRELFLQVLYHVLGDSPDQWPHRPIQVPPEWCLVNRNWYRAATPLLYSWFEFDGHPGKIYSLWVFWLTILERPDLAVHVRHLRLLTQFKAPRLPEDAAGMYREAAPLAKKKLAEAGLGNVGDPEGDLNQGNNLPILALILLYCPRLVSLALHVAVVDPYLDALLASAVIRHWETGNAPLRLAFQSLRRLHIATDEEASPSDGSPSSIAVELTGKRRPSCIGKRRPFLRLPNLQELRLIDAVLESDVDTPSEDTSLTELTIVFNSPVENLRPVLQYTTKLTKLSLSLDTVNEQFDVSIHQKLWDAILPLRHQLEYLDLFEPPKPVPWNKRHELPKPFLLNDHLSFCCPLYQFTKLRQLCITPRLLLGNNCAHTPSLKFVSHLPRSLQSFALYGRSSQRIIEGIECLEDEISAIPLNKPLLLPLLLSIVIDSPNPPRRLQHLWRSNVPGKHIADICVRKRIMWHTNSGLLLLEGGRKTFFAIRTHNNIPTSPDNTLARLKKRRAADIVPMGLNVQGYRGVLNESSFDKWAKRVGVWEPGEDGRMWGPAPEW